VWRFWTEAALLAEWWAPEHFTVAGCEADAVPGGRLRLVLAEGDGTRHEASGRFLALSRPRTLRFELAPLGPGRRALFAATHAVRLDERPEGTDLSLEIRVTPTTSAGAPALAGLRLGWEQSLAKLERALARAEHDQDDHHD
jgi:uncharacterized protein YndB with AHSA1/START domain